MRDTNLINKLKSDFKEYGETCRMIGELTQILLVCSNSESNRKKNEDKIKKVSNELNRATQTKIKLEQRWL